MVTSQKKPTLGLICARGGSKGVLRKNSKLFCGKPLIAWSIEVAKNCDQIDDVVVSTDDRNIADISLEYGAEVPFLRPSELASDSSKQIDTIAHALHFLKNEGRTYNTVVLLQPTCPLRMTEDISSALSVFRETAADSVVSVIKEDGVKLSTYYDLNAQGFVSPKFQTVHRGTNRQDYSPIYRRCGLLYILNPDNVLELDSLYGKTTAAHIVPRERSFDIDTPFDWELAEFLMKKQLQPEEVS